MRGELRKAQRTDGFCRDAVAQLAAVLDPASARRKTHPADVGETEGGEGHVPEPAGRPNIRGRRASSGPINQQPGNNVNTAGTISAQNGGVATENGTSPTGKEAGTKAGSHTRAAKTFRAYLPSCHRTYSCVHCRAHLANHDELISKSFQGSQGKGKLQ